MKRKQFARVPMSESYKAARIVETVAEFVESFDAQVLHEWRLSDCIRAKFNIRPGKKWMRKNPNGWRGSTALREGTP